MAVPNMIGQKLADVARKTYLEDITRQQFLTDYSQEFSDSGLTESQFIRKFVNDKQENVYKKYRQKVSDSLTMSPMVREFGVSGAPMVRYTAAKLFYPSNVTPQSMEIFRTEAAPIANHLLQILNGPTAAVHTGKQVIDDALSMNARIRYATTNSFGVHASMIEQKRAYDNIAKQGGKFVEFDLEGSGKYVHEFAFTHVDPSIKNAAHVDAGSIVNGIIGMNDQEYAEAMSLIEQYKRYGIYKEKNGHNLGVHKSERYRLEGYAKFGSEKTSWTKNADGIVQLTGYASDEDVKTLNIEEVIRGVEEKHNIWKDQTAKLVKFGKFDVYAHEKAILDELLKIKSSGQTIVTQNGMGYDVGQFDMLFSGSQASAGGRAAYRSLTGSGSISGIAPHLDIVNTLREAGRITSNDKKYAGAIAKAKESWNSSKALMIRFAGGEEKVMKQAQEALGNTFVQHAAVPDTVAQALEALGMMDSIFDSSSPDYIFGPFEKQREHIAKVGDIFYVRHGMFANNGYGNLSFTKDALTGEIRFAGGAKVSADGSKVSPEIVSQGLKSNSLAMLAGIEKISVNDLSSEVLAELGVDAGQKELIATYWMAYGGSEGAARSHNIQVHLTTLEKTQEFLNNQLFAGSVRKQSIAQKIKKKGIDTKDWTSVRWLEELASGDHNKLVDISDVDGPTKRALTIDGSEKYSFEKLANRSEKVLENDSTANWIREMNYDKWQKTEKYLDLIEKRAAASKNGEAVTTADIVAAAQDIGKESMDPSGKGTAKSLRRIFETDFKGEKSYMSNTTDSAMRSAGYTWDMRYLYGLAKQAADKFGRTRSEKNLYFTAYFGHLMGSIAQATGSDLNAVTGRDVKISQLGFQKDLFRVNIASIRSEGRVMAQGGPYSNAEDYIDINIFERSPHFGKKLLRKLEWEDERESEALRLMASVLNRQYGTKINTKEFQPDMLMDSITKALRGLRKEVPKAGLVPATSMPDLTAAPTKVLKFLEKHKDNLTAVLGDPNEADKVIGTFVDGKKFVPDVVAKKYAKVLFKDSLAIDEEKLKGYGYTEDVARYMIAERGRRLRDTERLLSEVFEKAIAKNPYIKPSYDPVSGALLLHTGNGGELNLTKHMVFDRFDEGRGEFYSQVGGRRVAARSMLTNDGVHSWVEGFRQEVASKLHFVNDINIMPKESLERLDWVFSKSESVIGALSVTRKDMQDLRAGISIDLSGYFKRLGWLNSRGAFDRYGFTGELRKVLNDLADKTYNQGYNNEVTPTHRQLIVLQSNFDKLITPFADINSQVSDWFFAGDTDAAKSFAKLVPHLNMRGNKHPENMYAYVGADGLSALGGMDGDNRYIETVRTLEFDYEEAATKNENLRKIARPGRAIMSEMDAVKYDGLEGVRRATRDRALRVRHLAMNSDLVGEVVQAGIEAVLKDRTYGITSEAEIKGTDVLYNYLNESGGMMSPDLLDVLPKSIMQKQKTKDLMMFHELHDILGRDRAETELKLRKSTNEVIELANGKITFKYGDEVLVQAGENLDWLKTWVGTADNIKADREGFLYRKLVNRDTGRIAEEREIQEAIDANKHLFKGITDKGLLRQRIGEVLSDKYEEKYFVEAIDALGARKGLVNTEKSVLTAPMAYLGEFDEYIQRVIGADGSGKQERLRLTVDVLGNEKRLKEVLEKHGYSFNAAEYDRDKFLKAAIKERNFYFDLFTKGATALAGEDLSNVSVIGNTFSEAIKDSHGELAGDIAGKINTAIEYMVMDNGISYEKARDELYEKFVAQGIFTDKDGNVLEKVGSDAMKLGKLTKLEVDKMEEILAPYLYSGYDKDNRGILKHAYQNGKMILSGVELAPVYDANEAGLNRGGNKKGILATRRMIENLGQEIYGNASLNKVWDTYSAAYGADEAAKKFNEIYQGVATVQKDKAGEYFVQLDEGMGGKNVNQALIENIQEEIVAGDVSASRINLSNYKKVAEKYGMEADKVKAILEGLGSDVPGLHKTYTDIGTDFVMHSYAYKMSHDASKINDVLAKTSSVSEQEEIIAPHLKDFVLENLQDVDFQSQRMNDGNPFRINRSMMVDLGKTVEDLTGLRYMALPYQSFSVMNERNGEGVESHSKIAKKLSSLATQVANIDKGGETSEYALKSVIDSVVELRSLINMSATSKYGELANATSAYLYGSGMFKAGIFNAADASNPLLQAAQYDGESIADMYKRGRRVNAMFVGTDFFKNALKSDEMDDLLKSIDKSGVKIDSDTMLEEMMDLAEKEGVKGIGLRQPMEYMNSVASSQIYLARNLASNQVLMTDSMAVGMNADMDGDLAYSYLVRTKARVFKDGEEIGSARLNELQISQLQKKFDGLDGNFTIEYDDSVFKGLQQANDLLANAAYSGSVDKIAGRSDYEKMHRALSEKYSERSLTVDGKRFNFHNMDIETRTAADAYYDEIVASDKFQALMQEGGYESIEKMDGEGLKKTAQKYLDEMAEGSVEREDAARAFARGINNLEFRGEMASKLARKDAGLANMSTYRFKGVVNMLKEANTAENVMTLIDDRDAEVIGKMMEHLNEAGQAPKNSLQSWTAEELNDATSSFFGVYNGRPDSTKLFKIIDMEVEAAGSDGIKELRTLPEYANVHNAAENIKAAFSRILPNGSALNERVWEAFRQGYTQSDFMTDVMASNHNDLARTVQMTTQSILGEAGFDLKDAGLLVKARAPIRDAEEELLQASNFEDVEPTFSENISGIFKGLKKSFHGHGAMAMLGFAGVTMMAGVMGGAPTAPPSAQGQAQGIQADSAMYEIPSTMGTPGNAGGANQSYIININASTDRGRDFVETALKQAFSAMPHKEQGMNMTMNIKDSSSNIGYSDIVSQFKDML